MTSFTYENQGNNTYLVYEIKDTDVLDTMSLGMLTNNRIPGIAQTLFTQMDRTRLLRFNVSAKVNVSQFFSGTVNKKRLMGVFNGITDAMLSAEDYMIDENTILLDKEYIFTDVSTCDTVMICLPVTSAQNSNPDLGTFFKDVMFTTQFDQTENCDYIAKIINYLNSAPRFSLVDFKSVLDEITKGAAAEPERPAVQQVPVQQPPVQQPPVQQPPVQQPPVQQPPVQTPPMPQQPPVQQTPPVQQPPRPNTPPVPPQQTPGIPPIPPMNGNQGAPQAAPEEKGMSWFYLMQHYNKENAAAYKAQKEARKRGAAAPQQIPPQQPPMPPQPPRQTPPQQQTPPANGFGFAVPGAMPPQPPKAGKQQTPPVPQQVNPTPVQNIPAQPAVQQVPQNAYVPVQASHGQMANFGETTVLGGGSIGETTVLGAAPAPSAAVPKPILIRLKNNERIPLNKPVFRVGKERSYVDYFVGDNPAISRSHANFIIRDGEYFVVDTNSTNHTYVNDRMINSSVETKVNDGDRVRLANEEFEFKVQL